MGNISYFLGCSSPEGFHSFFGELCPTHSGGYTYIIKGGPGTGKSSLMKRINSALTDAGIETELIYCSSDPASLDGVYAPALNCWIADGTSPHTLEPKYPGAAQEIVDLGRFWDKNILRSRADEVIALTDENAACHRRCRRFLEASALLREDILRLHLRWHAAFSSVSAMTSSARERRISLFQNLPRSTVSCAAPGYFGSSVCGEVPSAIQQLSAGAYTPSSEAGSDEQYISSVSIPASVSAEFIRFIRLDFPVPRPPFIIYVYPPE